MYMPIIIVRNLGDLGLNPTSPSWLRSIWSLALLGFSLSELGVDIVRGS